MIVNAWGIVLARRPHGEADRLCTIYTETMGKLLVRFVGVNKPGRKLKALSEPLCWGEYRLYVSARTDVAKAIGGRLIGTFPSIRSELSRTVAALGCCELLSYLSADRAANPEEYALLCGALQALEAAPSPWLAEAFGLRLLELAGYGLTERHAGADAPLWDTLSRSTWAELAALPWEAQAAGRLRQAVLDHAEAQSGRPLKTRAFLDGLEPQPAAL